MEKVNRLELPWEQNISGSPGAVIRSAKGIIGHPAYRLKLLAISKMIDVTIISSDFGGETVVFEIAAWLLRDFGARVDFSAVYAQAYPSGDRTDNRPDICVRTAAYDRDEDYKLFHQASDKIRYLHHDQPCNAFSHFMRSDTQPRIAELINELERVLADGIPIERIPEDNDRMHTLRVYGYPRGAECEVMYPATTHRSETVERWARSWYECCRGVRQLEGIPPDGLCRFSYRQSIFDRFVALSQLSHSP